jgi:hypothetical protein
MRSAERFPTPGSLLRLWMRRSMDEWVDEAVRMVVHYSQGRVLHGGSDR